ncbi:MAG: hypothetical protein WAU38_10395, partial [Ignavibacteria bacterium]
MVNAPERIVVDQWCPKRFCNEQITFYFASKNNNILGLKFNPCQTFSLKDFDSKHSDHPLNPPPCKGGGSPL